MANLIARLARAPNKLHHLASPGGVILAYHRVADLPVDPHRLAVSPRRFAEHLQVIRRLGRPMSLGELTRRIRERQSIRRAIVVTFDDGYADNCVTAAPLLAAHDMPATIFVATGQLGRHREFAWDELAALLLERPTPRPRLHARLHRTLRRLNAGGREQMLDRLAARLGVSQPGIRSTHRTMSAEDVRRLADGRLVEIGAHTMTHPHLASLPASEQQREIGESKRILEDIAGRAVTSFSYPFGGPCDYTADTVEAVGAAGYQCACVNSFRPVRWWSDPLQLPRLTAPDCNGDELARHLRYLAFS